MNRITRPTLRGSATGALLCIVALTGLPSIAEAEPSDQEFIRLRNKSGMDFTKVKTGPANLSEASLDDHGALANGEVMVIEWDGTDGTCNFNFALYVGDERKLYQSGGAVGRFFGDDEEDSGWPFRAG